MEAVALWVNRKPNKEFDLQMTGSQEVLFWYERTIISLQFFINLIRRKYFRIHARLPLKRLYIGQFKSSDNSGELSHILQLCTSTSGRFFRLVPDSNWRLRFTGKLSCIKMRSQK